MLVFSFEEWIAQARLYAKQEYGSDGELGEDADMRDFYNDDYNHVAAVDAVFRDGLRTP